MDFIRFTGEFCICFVLIALGRGVLIGLTVGLFEAIGLGIENLIGSWIVPCGAAGARVVATWLVEANRIYRRHTRQCPPLQIAGQVVGGQCLCQTNEQGLRFVLDIAWSSSSFTAGALEARLEAERDARVTGKLERALES